jgi:hypothetical protein
MFAFFFTSLQLLGKIGYINIKLKNTEKICEHWREWAGAHCFRIARSSSAQGCGLVQDQGQYPTCFPAPLWAIKACLGV